MIEYQNMVAQVATELKRQYPMVDRDDISQELWVWLASNPEKIEEWGEGKQAERKVATSLRRAGRGYCIREKSALTGYELEDLYFYSTGQLRELLPVVMDRALWTDASPGVDAGHITGGGDPAHGNTRLAMLCDVRSSLEAVSEADKELLFTIFGLQVPEEIHALECGVTEETLRKRVQRALQRLQRALGGPKPPPEYLGSRKVLSNAQAQAQTRNQEEPE